MAFSDVRASQKVHTLLEIHKKFKFQVPETPNGCLQRPRFVAFSDVRASQKVHTLLEFHKKFKFQKLPTAVYDVRALWLSLTSALPKRSWNFWSSTRNSSSIIRSLETPVPAELGSGIFNIEIQVPRSSAEFRHLITE